MDETETLPSASEVEANFMTYINQTSSRYHDFLTASFVPVARVGLSADLLSLTSYVDYDVAEYLLETGSSTLTIV